MKKSLRYFWVILMVGVFVLIQPGCGKKAERKPYEILTKTTDKMAILYLEHMGSYDKLAPLFGQLEDLAAKKGLSGKIMSMYYDDPATVPAERLRSEIGIMIPYGFMPDSGYSVQEIPARKVVYALLKGPYTEIVKEYPYIIKWMEEKGYKMDRPVIEIYLVGGPNVPPEQLVTEVQFPIE